MKEIILVTCSEFSQKTWDEEIWTQQININLSLGYRDPLCDGESEGYIDQSVQALQWRQAPAHHGS